MDDRHLGARGEDAWTTGQGAVSGPASAGGPCSAGWAVALLAGLAISPLLRGLYGLLAGPPIARGEVGLEIAVVSLVSGFLSFLGGGYVAGRLASGSGGKNGALTAVLGLAVGVALTVLLALVGVAFAEGVAMPPASFGLAGAALLAGLVLFLANLLGGYVGGKWGEPSSR